MTSTEGLEKQVIKRIIEYEESLREEIPAVIFTRKRLGFGSPQTIHIKVLFTSLAHALVDDPIVYVSQNCFLLGNNVSLPELSAIAKVGALYDELRKFSDDIFRYDQHITDYLFGRKEIEEFFVCEEDEKLDWKNRVEIHRKNALQGLELFVKKCWYPQSTDIRSMLNHEIEHLWQGVYGLRDAEKKNTSRKILMAGNLEEYSLLHKKMAELSINDIQVETPAYFLQFLELYGYNAKKMQTLAGHVHQSLAGNVFPKVVEQYVGAWSCEHGLVQGYGTKKIKKLMNHCMAIMGYTSPQDRASFLDPDVDTNAVSEIIDKTTPLLIYLDQTADKYIKYYGQNIEDRLSGKYSIVTLLPQTTAGNQTYKKE